MLTPQSPSALRICNRVGSLPLARALLRCWAVMQLKGFAAGGGGGGGTPEGGVGLSAGPPAGRHPGVHRKTLEPHGQGPPGHGQADQKSQESDHIPTLPGIRDPNSLQISGVARDDAGPKPPSSDASGSMIQAGTVPVATRGGTTTTMGSLEAGPTINGATANKCSGEAGAAINGAAAGISPPPRGPELMSQELWGMISINGW